MNKTIPKKKMKWITTEIRQKIRERIKAERTYKKKPSTDNLLIYKRVKAETRRMMNKTRTEMWEEFLRYRKRKNAVEQDKTDIRQKKTHQISHLITSNEDDPKMMTDELAQKNFEGHCQYTKTISKRKKEREEEKPLHLDYKNKEPYNSRLREEELDGALAGCAG
jgi:hypothetical protein